MAPSGERLKYDRLRECAGPPVVYSVANFEYVWGEVPGGTHVEKLPAGGSQFKDLKLLKLQNTGSRLKWGLHHFSRTMPTCN